MQKFQSFIRHFFFDGIIKVYCLFLFSSYCQKTADKNRNVRPHLDCVHLCFSANFTSVYEFSLYRIDNVFKVI